MTIHPPRHRLEELAVDAAVHGDAELRAHLAACAPCTARLQGLQAARATFLALRDPADFARAVKARQSASRPAAPRVSRAGWMTAGGLALAAAISLVWLRPAPAAIRLKGSQSLSVFVQHHGQPEPLVDGQSLAAGDRLAFSYSLTKPSYLLLLSIDEAGVITKYYPPDTSAGVRLSATTRAQLPVGVELDAHRGEERLYALFSGEPLDEARARDALRSALREAQTRGVGLAGMAPVALPAEQTSRWFRKP